MEQQTIKDKETNTDWRKDITTPKNTLKILDGDSITFTFTDEGVLKESEDYGKSIAFSVLLENEKEPKMFYVKANNFSLLGQIKCLDELTGLKVRVTRIGSKRSDTRYTIKKL